jgi:hypothetical protein
MGPENFLIAVPPFVGDLYHTHNKKGNTLVSRNMLHENALVDLAQDYAPIDTHA